MKFNSNQYNIMSNQVFSNNISKYYDYPGINVYTIPNPIVIAPGPTSVFISYNAPAVVIDDQNMINIGTGNLSVRRNGMYSISAILNLARSNPTTDTTTVDCVLTLARPGQFTSLSICEYQMSLLPTTAASGGGTTIITLSNTLYLKVNDVIAVNIINTAVTGATLTLTTSTFNVAKIY